jgi:hypothetical protein
VRCDNRIIEPAAHRLAIGDRGRFTGEDEEGGLESVFGVLRMAQNPAADAQHHRAVSPYQGGEGGLIAAGDEAREELAIRQVIPAGGMEDLMKVFEGLAQTLCRHADAAHVVPRCS